MDELNDWLERHGLFSLAAAMIENDIDRALLPELTEQDLKDLGLNIGQRRRLLNAIKKELADQAEPNGVSVPIAIEPLPQTGTAQHPADQAERRQLTVLFCDLVGSTELSQRLDPEELRETMRAYQDAAAGTVTRYGGHVAKYLGDGVLAYFGWPAAYEDQAERAVRAGLEMSRAVKTISAPDGTQLASRIGIASGDVVIGDLVNVAGTEAGAVTGETPNLAARLQSVAGPGEVMISDGTLRLTGAAFEIESGGTYALRGYSDPVQGYAVLGEREVESRFEATRGAQISALVGRVHEIGLLAERWKQAQVGDGTVVLLSGEAGIGKSRLIEAMAKQVNEDGGEIIRLQCSPYFSSSALHPVIERIRRAAGISQDDDDSAQLVKLRDLLAREGGDPETTLRIYAGLLSIEMPPDCADPDLMPEELKELTLKVLLERPVQLSRKAPLLLVLEDAHWIDPSTLELMERLVARVAELPVMIVVTHRPEWSTDWSGMFGHVTALTVGRLDRSHIAELMEKTFGYPPSPDLVDDIAQRTEGVPLFIEEFCQAIAGQTDADSVGEVTIPATLQGSLMSRLDRLPREARSLALVASVIGREFDSMLLRQVTGFTSAALEEGLAALRQMQVIFASGSTSGSYIFRHALIQDTAYQSLLKRTRQSHHGAVARTLETHHPEILAREPELVAHHYAAAGDDSAARPLWMRAAERAYSRSAAFEAVSHAREAFRTARDSGRHEIEARIMLGRALQSAGQIGPANQTLREAIDLARLLDDNALFADSVLTFANTLYLSMEPAAEALPLLEEALGRLPAENDVLTSQILTYLVRGSVLAGERVRARRYRARAIEAARSCGDNVSLHGMQIIPYILPLVHREPEEVADWRSKIDEMLETADQMNDDTKGRARSIAFYVAAEMGDRDHMEKMLACIQEVGEARQHMHMAWVHRHGDAMLAILDGRFEEAERLSKEALELGRQTHGEDVEGVYGIQMFTIRREQGRLGEVAPVVKRMIDEDPGATAWKPGFAVIASDLGYEAPAQRILDEMAEGDFALELDSKYSTTLSYLAEVATRLGDEARCEKLYKLLLPYRDLTITAGVTTVCVGAADRYLGLLASALGDWEIAEAHFRDAIALEERMRAGPWLAHTQHELADMLERRGMIGDDIEIADLREKVLEAASRLGMKALHDKYRRYLQ